MSPRFPIHQAPGRRNGLDLSIDQMNSFFDLKNFFLSWCQIIKVLVVDIHVNPFSSCEGAAGFSKPKLGCFPVVVVEWSLGMQSLGAVEACAFNGVVAVSLIPKDVESAVIAVLEQTHIGLSGWL